MIAAAAAVSLLSLLPHGALSEHVAASTPGLSIAFGASAVPVSVKNAQGHELLGAGSVGFTLHCTTTGASDKQKHNTCNQSTTRVGVPFDTVAAGPGPNAFTFGVSSSGEQLDVTFSGANHYLTANITSTRGFEWGDGKSVDFALTGKGPANDGALRGMGLNFLIDGGGGEGHATPAQPFLHYEAPWVNSTWNPHARFAIYERVDDVTVSRVVTLLP